MDDELITEETIEEQNTEEGIVTGEDAMRDLEDF